ncbi:hypothetical protein PHET_02219 [Paragonimus heterotremus]|uniref:EF-hand domain-containing protein n=1 Tax=Paragonimus heterotremus TaxID=100268 RepID=A0A8J4T224_9TREM|nr:hypothetical protein PHET_02219 [Paragonimus heterotremus]
MNYSGTFGFSAQVRWFDPRPLTSTSCKAQYQLRFALPQFVVFQDNDGYITKVELHQIMIRIGHNFTDEEIESMLSEADKDGDGKVTFEEFEAMLKDG